MLPSLLIITSVMHGGPVQIGPTFCRPPELLTEINDPGHSVSLCNLHVNVTKSEH